MSRCSWGLAKLAPLLVTLLFTNTVLADGGRSIQTASQLFDQGVEQQRSGDYKSAARSFARADELVPDPTALEAALRAALQADEAVLGMALVDRSRREPASPALSRAVADARAKFAGRVGRLTVRCTGCKALVDAEPIEANTPRWIEPGEHDLVITVGERADRRTLRVDAGSMTDVVPMEPQAPLPPPKAAPAPSSKLSPAWFWIALGTTAVAGGATIASGVDTSAKHDAFEKTPTPGAADAGEAAETRTNVLVGVTAALGLATAGLALFAVRWSAPAPTIAIAVGAAPRGVTTSLAGRF